MKFSVVISTYNRLSLLKRAVESALAQTVDCEVVVADDCSRDGTEDYLRSLRERLGERVVYCRNEKNLGHSQTVNAGVAAATGDWIKLIDDDDYLAPHCLEVMAKAIAARPDAAICSCQAIQVDSEGKELSCTKPVGTLKAFYVLKEDIHYGMLIEMLPFGTPVQVAVRKEAFLKAEGWDPAFNGDGDDIEAWVRIAEHGDAIFINQPLAYRTLWTGNCSSQLSLKKRLDTNIKIKQEIYDRVHQKYRALLPKTKDVFAFLELHWGLVGIKHGKMLDGFKLLYPSLLSPTAFAYIAQSIYRRSQNKPLDMGVVQGGANALGAGKFSWIVPKESDEREDGENVINEESSPSMLPKERDEEEYHLSRPSIAST